MRGDTYTITYGGAGRYSSFQNQMHVLWGRINKKYRFTAWRGK